MASPDAQLIRILEGLPLSSDGLDGLDGATPEAESPLVAAEPAQPPAAADSRVRRRKRTPKLWSAADEGRVDDLRAALEQRKDSFASSGPTARLASSSGGAVSSGPTRSINWCNDAGTTALHAASLSGHEACVQLLLDAHAALDPRQKGGATPLILAARQGHSECVARLLGAGADLARRDATGTALDNARSTSCWGVQGDDDEEDELEERLEGSNARCIEILEAAELQQKHEQTFLLGQRQREAAALAHDAAALLAGPHLGRVVLDHRPRASSVAGAGGGSGGSGGADATGAAPPAIAAAKPRAKFGIGRGGAKGAAAAAAAEQAAEAEALLSHRNELLRSCCEAMALHGFEPGHLSPPSLAAWVASASGRERLCQLAEQLPQPTDEQGRALSGRELALAIRVVQMHLREAAQPAAGGVLGMDQLVPLLEPLVVEARPARGWSLHATMSAIAEQELLDKPDLASAVDGWETACVGVEAQAVARWRRGTREAAFWGALCRQPPPDVLLAAVCLEKRPDSLPQVFGSFLANLEAAEEELWGCAASAAAHATQVAQLVAEMCPGGGGDDGSGTTESLDVFGPHTTWALQGLPDVTQAV